MSLDRNEITDLAIKKELFTKCSFNTPNKEALKVAKLRHIEVRRLLQLFIFVSKYLGYL